MQLSWLILILLALTGCVNVAGAPDTSIRQPPEDQLILVEVTDRSRLIQFDPHTGRRTTLFEPPAYGWINQIDLAADQSTLLLSYTPPPATDGAALFDRAGIYTLALDPPGGSPTPLLLPEAPNIFYFNPVWTPDRRYLFYVSFIPAPEEPSTFEVTLWRYEAATDQTRKIADDGIWPRLSPDGQRLVYITVDPETLERGLVTSDLDSRNLIELVPIGTYFDIDTPLFSADSRELYFAASQANRQIGRLWWERLLGLRLARAHTDHNVPVEWWRIPAAGGPAEKMIDEAQLIVFGALGRDGRTLYFTTIDGLFAADTHSGQFQPLASATAYRNFVVVARP